MKSKINIILPIALAVILPGLNFLSNTDMRFDHAYGFYERWFYSSLVLYCFWYVLLYISRLQTKYRVVFIALSIIVSVVIIYFIFALFIFKNNDGLIKWLFINKFIFASVLFLLIQYALGAQKSISKLQLEKEQIQSENYKVQLQELRAKVEPHFLFNSLNTLRTMIRHNNVKAEDYVMNLSNFYRQTLRFDSSSVISLEDEIEVLKSYIFLIQTRNEGAVIVTIDIAEKWMSFKIPVLILQIVTENCFKHNRISASNPLEIIYTIENDGYISVKNKILPKLTRTESSGYGLKNILKRYELLGIENGVLVEKNQEEFDVKLKLIST